MKKGKKGLKMGQKWRVIINGGKFLYFFRGSRTPKKGLKKAKKRKKRGKTAKKGVKKSKKRVI